ncbi:site-specific integrase [Streptobacillus moniliformis]|uniref:site-specific integrase n=1 Tax=Streptobacillus moniliformis TaxID=34105 RepID=UPI0007E3F6B8|nr:site-specific integrase [Streptobacillus moniliformis]
MASFKELSKGNWQVSFYCKNYLGENKKHKKTGFRTKKEANDYMNEFINKMTGNSDVLFSTVSDEFIEYKKKYIKARTISLYKSQHNKIKKNTIGEIPLKKLTKKILFNFLESFNDKKTTAQFLKKYIKSVLDYANINYNFNDFSILNFKLEKKDDKINKKYEIWTLEDFNIFDDILKNEKLKDRVFFNLLYYTGARIGEITALTLNDIDIEKKIINISKTRIDANNYNTPKTKSSNRIVSIPDKAFNILQEYLNTLPRLKTIFIFSSVPMYQSFFKKIVEKYKLKKITIHDFRHSHASLLIKKGVPITDISKRLGHATPNITLGVYSHFYKEDKDNVIDLLNNL